MTGEQYPGGEGEVRRLVDTMRWPVELAEAVSTPEQRARLTLDDFEAEPKVAWSELGTSVLKAIITPPGFQVRFANQTVFWEVLGEADGLLAMRQTGTYDNACGYMLMGGSLYVPTNMDTVLTPVARKWLAGNALSADGQAQLTGVTTDGMPFVVGRRLLARNACVCYWPALPHDAYKDKVRATKPKGGSVDARIFFVNRFLRKTLELYVDYTTKPQMTRPLLELTDLYGIDRLS